MTSAFPEIIAAAAALPADCALDGELVVWADDRLQGRLNRTPAGVARLAAQWPAHFVAFDLLRRGADGDLTGHSYAARRAALEALFAEYRLGTPWVLCPSTTDRAVTEDWLSWSAVGMEGLVFKPLDQRYAAGRRGWKKYHSRASTEAVVGAASGPPASLPPCLPDDGPARPDGCKRRSAVRRPHIGAFPRGGPGAGRSAGPAVGQASLEGVDVLGGMGQQRRAAGGSGGPVLVAEVAADVSLDTAGRWRHPVRWLRLRTYVSPADVPLLGVETGRPAC